MVGLGAVPGSLFATLSPTVPPAVSTGLASELAELADVRELLIRRRALGRALDDRIAALASEIEALRERRDRTWATLRHERDEAAFLDRELDRLVPRFLVRAGAIQARREQAAKVLADLASMSRQVELDATIRARLLAISPMMLRRLRRAEAGLAKGGDLPDAMIARHREIETRGPQLLAERQRLERLREQKQRQQRVAADQLTRLNREVTGLNDRQALLARHLLQAERAYLARAEPASNQPALRDNPLVVRPDHDAADASVKGVVTPRPRSAQAAVGSVDPSLSAVVGRVAPGYDVAAQRAELPVRAQLPTMPPPPAKPLNVVLKGDVGRPLPAASRSAADRTSDVVFLETAAARSTALGSAMPQIRPIRLERPETPIMPVPGKILPSSAVGERPAITIVATPGQAVAAPEDGRVVFAGEFKSYGLLLIIEHARDYHILLWGLGRLDVEADETVRTGQIVGVMGAGDARPPELHVELRRNGRPVNPLRWLASSNNKARG